MTTSVTIRKATLSDISQLRNFEQGVISAELPFDVTLRQKTYYYDLEQMIDDENTCLVVAEMNEELIASGYARIEKAKHYLQHPFFAYLGFMYVIPSQRGKGINQMILSHLEKWAHEKNITELRLEVYSANDPAIRAYEKFGFQRHMILMRKGL